MSLRGVRISRRHVRKKFGLRIRCRLSDGRFQSLQLSLPCVNELTNV